MPFPPEGDRFEITFEYDDPNLRSDAMPTGVTIDNFVGNAQVWFQVESPESGIYNWIPLEKAEEIAYALLTAAHNQRVYLIEKGLLDG